MGAKSKWKGRPGDLVVSVTMTVHAEPDQANTASYSVVFDVNGPETVVGIVQTAYQLGALNRGIDAFVAAVARSLGPQPPVSMTGKAGRA